ncbi:MAG: GUN4 domain-containing protein [Crocosphaera sp.]|nr:GUN4 domain-containing protein [Crocosphaera sp.]
MSAGMIGFHIVNVVLNLINSQLVREATERLEDKRLEFQKWQQSNNHKFQREQFEKQKELQFKLAEDNRKAKLELAKKQRETQLELLEKQRETQVYLEELREVSQNWPLRTLRPASILKAHQHDTFSPLRLIPIPPIVDYDSFGTVNKSFPNIEEGLAQGLREFLSKYYSHNNIERPVELLDGAWDSKRYHGGSVIGLLHGWLKSEPILILESVIDGNHLHFRFAYWGQGQKQYSYQSLITNLPYREIVYESVKSRALKWKETQTKLEKLGKSPEEINRLGEDNVTNLKILEQEEEYRRLGFELQELDLQKNYKVNEQDLKYLCQFLANCHCLVAGFIADIHYLIQNNVPPLLPKWLPELIQNCYHPQLLESITQGYRQVYQAVENERPAWIPELALDLANSLKYLPDKSWAKEQVKSSIQSWLRVRGVTPPEGMEEAISAMKSVISWEDKEYYTALHNCLREVEESLASQVKGLPILKSLTTGVDYTKLHDLLVAGKWQEADFETVNVMLQAANRVSEGHLRVEDIDNFPCDDLRIIDQLWVHYSKGKFGFSVLKKIYVDELGGTRVYNKEVWQKFCDRVGWRKEGSYVSYSDLTFELQDTTPVGHLPTGVKEVDDSGIVWFVVERIGFWGLVFCRAETCKL